MMNSALLPQRVLFSLFSFGHWEGKEYSDEGIVPFTKTTERISPPSSVDARDDLAAVVRLEERGDIRHEDGTLLGVRLAGREVHGNVLVGFCG